VINELIFDVGMHEGQDTGYYLSKGYGVVAIDADPRLVDRAGIVFADAVRTGKLTLACCAIGDADEMLDFHLSEKSIWNSTNKAVSTRENVAVHTVQVPGRRLANLFAQHGVPFYCKIDIEGMDAACLRTLRGAADLPRYISVESECIGDRDALSDAQALETLDELLGLGYRKFKLVDQTSLLVLTPSASVYRERPSLLERARRRVQKHPDTPYGYWDAVAANRARLTTAHGYEFPKSASGPFGADLDGDWLTADDARKTLLRHRRDYFKMPDAKPYGFWCDWHATW
jgi:FkbM family methyltransferase